MPDYKPIHFNLFDPSNAIFKGMKSHKAEIQVITCCNSENCDLYKRGQCTYRRTLSWQKCPYGKYIREEGFTNKASKFRDWINKKRQQYEGVPSLKEHNDFMAVVGEYILLPYAFMDMCESVPFLAHGGGFRSGNAFLKIEDFTVENILKLVNFDPHALFGGSISDYQKKSVPLFIKHLSEIMPDLYEKVWNLSDKVKEIAKSMTNVGRKAKLRSINPNIGVLRDIHNGEWVWDGEWLISKNTTPSFMLVRKVDEVRIHPVGNPEITITDDGQVNSDTEFLS